MIKVAALTSGRNVPSTRFRIRQHIDGLKDCGIDVKEYCPAINKYQPMPLWPTGVRSSYALPLHILWQMTKLSTRVPGVIASRAADVTWLGRELLPGYPTMEKLLKKPIIFDVDDAIWMGKPFGEKTTKVIAGVSECVVAGNDFIADWFDKYAKNVVIVPTAVDAERYSPEKRYDFGDDFIVGWIGTSANLKYIEEIESAIKRFLRGGGSRLLIVCDQKPVLSTIDEKYIIYVPWSAENEVKMIQNMDVGLMPLTDSAWVHGKCSFKMLQYMSCAKPVVVSPVGMNVDVMAKGDIGEAATTNNDWYHALNELKNNNYDRCLKGQQGRAVVNKNYSKTIVTKMISEIILDVV